MMNPLKIFVAFFCISVMLGARADLGTADYKTLEEAQAAIKILAQARQQVERDYAQAYNQCIKQVLAQSCIQEARDVKQKSQNKLQQNEIAARAYVRQAQAQEREQKIAENEVRRKEVEANRKVQVQQKEEASTKSSPNKKSNQNEMSTVPAKTPKTTVDKETPRAKTPQPSAARPPLLDTKNKSTAEKERNKAQFAAKAEEVKAAEQRVAQKKLERETKRARQSEQDAQNQAAANPLKP